jgi:hypothetical protein
MNSEVVVEQEKEVIFINRKRAHEVWLMQPLDLGEYGGFLTFFYSQRFVKGPSFSVGGCDSVK